MTAGTYNLLVQKQSGRRTQELTVTISPEKGGVKNWVTDLWTDKFFQ